MKPAQAEGLEKLEIVTLADLLRHFPNRYEIPSALRMINELKAGELATVYGQVRQTKITLAFRKKIPMAEVVIEDATGRVKAIWFHQAYLAKKIHEGDWVKLSGKVTSKLYFANPSFEMATDSAGGPSLFHNEPDSETVSALKPIYSETRGLSSAWFEYSIKELLTSGLATELAETLPEALRARYHLPKLAEAFTLVHQPRQEREAVAARKRFAFEEIFFIQLERLISKREYEKNGAYQIKTTNEILNEFISRLPFSPTGAQRSAIDQIFSDLGEDRPMMRLLEGDVGSGKTVVAAAASYAVVKAGYEVALMAPTEILARQHFESFIKNFIADNVSVGLITSSECLKFPSKLNPRAPTHISRAQFLKWVANGDIPIVVGTHSLIQKAVKFKNLALAIIDEQHRFGTKQRSALVKKDRSPHLLSLTATPIPRTLALTIYGDLDLTLLDELPPGRKPIITEIVIEANRRATYDKIRIELKLGRQVFVICPRIDAPDLTKELALNAKSAKQEAHRLQEEIFPEFSVGLVHSKLRPKEKEEVMASFASGEIEILVATSVVEVGVNVPNATVILIEGAERFGLAQLHQLRGRVWRSNHQAYCFLFTSSTGDTAKPKTGKVIERLRAVQTAKNGFELAELDLKLRGSGSLTGGKQWGISDLGMEALQNLKMVEAARREAQELFKTDPTLKNYPEVKTRLALSTARAIHFE